MASAAVSAEHDEVDGRGHRAAPGVPHDQDQLRPGHGAAVLHAAQHLPAGDVAGDADAEDVAHPQVEDQLGGRAGVDAAEHDGQRVLPAGRGARPGGRGRGSGAGRCGTARGRPSGSAAPAPG